MNIVILNEADKVNKLHF